MLFKISQSKLLQPLSSDSFDEQSAINYNIKTESYYKQYESEIKRVLNTSADWKSPEFAKVVYDWQKNNGLTGKLIDGKFGPITMSKVVKQSPILINSYDAYAPFKAAHENEKPSQKVIDLVPEVERIRNEMGATDIPLDMLLGWIQVESNGKLTSRGLESLDERGLFQISKEESNTIGIDHDRVAKEQDYSIRAGIELAQHYAKEADRILMQHVNVSKFFPKNSEMYWKLVFFTFSSGSATTEKLISNMEASGQTFSDWKDIMNFVASNPHGYKHSPLKWSWHVQRGFNLGSQAVKAGQRVAFNVLLRIKNAKQKAINIIYSNMNKLKGFEI